LRRDWRVETGKTAKVTPLQSDKRGKSKARNNFFADRHLPFFVKSRKTKTVNQEVSKECKIKQNQFA
jgi:hypothetical protein